MASRDFGSIMSPEANGDNCLEDGLLVPLVYRAFSMHWVRAVGYLALLLYLFLGIAIIADIFMCAIERITSRVKRVQIKSSLTSAAAVNLDNGQNGKGSTNGSANGDLNGLHVTASPPGGPGSDTAEPEVVEVRVWNDTVANLTLMALGSSAPEILLSCIEIIGKGFKAGDLGPGTIVGSAAFNLLVITAVCVVSIPGNEPRMIRSIKVFGVTSVFASFAYIWLFLILNVISPDEVELWEAFLTLLFFPILVSIAYAADRNFFRKRSLADKGPMELDAFQDEREKMLQWSGVDKEFFPKGRITKRSLAKFVKAARKVDPSLSMEDAACLAAVYIFDHETHSRLFYRVSAIRSLSGAGSPIPHLNSHLQRVYDLLKDKHTLGTVTNGHVTDGLDDADVSGTKETAVVDIIKTVPAELAHAHDLAVVQFAMPTAVVLENAGSVEVVVQRHGRADNAFSCLVETLDRTAKSGVEYEAKREVLHFAANEMEKKMNIKIFDNKKWDPDKIFLVKLSLLSELSSSAGGDLSEDDSLPTVPLVRPDVAKGRICMMQVTIVDDDEPGVIAFGRRLFAVPENTGTLFVPVFREQGADGDVTVRWKTVDGTARSGRDFFGGEGELVFPHGVVRQEIEIKVVDDFDEEKDEYFEVILTGVSKGGAKLGRINRTMVTITNDDNYQNVMSRLLKKVNYNRDKWGLHREAWIDQIKAAMTVDGETGGSNGGGGSSGEEVVPSSADSGVEARSTTSGEETEVDSGPGCMEYLLHFMSFGWKVLFAFIPPVGIANGWLTFTVSLVVIGILTAIVGDVASSFGCLIGLTDAVTAITFVALGTSLPDLFASRTAARMERHADNAIGNINGSNSVNVFLGLGLPWLMASLVWTWRGERFEVPPGNLGFSVALYSAVSIVCLGVIVARRKIRVFGPGELGGNPKLAWATAILFILLWIMYITLASLQSIGTIVV